jgi:hypothetical protein
MKNSQSGFLSETRTTREFADENNSAIIQAAEKKGMKVVDYMRDVLKLGASIPNWNAPQWAVEYDASKQELMSVNTAGISNLLSGMGKYTPWIIGTLALGFALAIPKGSPLHQMFRGK